MRGAASLSADLDDSVVLAGCGQHRLAFDHIDADRFLNVDVCTVFDRFDHRQSVPVVGGRNQDDIEIFLGEEFAIIRVGSGPLS